MVTHWYLLAVRMNIPHVQNIQPPFPIAPVRLVTSPRHPFTVADRISIVEWMRSTNNTPTQIQNSYNIDRKKIGRWASEIERGGIMMNQTGPRLLDDEGMKAWDGSFNADTPPNKFQCRANLTKFGTETAERRQAITEGTNVVPSPSTLKRYLVEANVRKVKPQTTTNARYNAERDPRNTYTWAVLLFSYCSDLYPFMVCNWDATTFSCSNDENYVHPVYIKSLPRSKNNEHDFLPVTVTSNNCLGIYIKKYFLHNSSGQVDPPVYIVAMIAWMAMPWSASKSSISRMSTQSMDLDISLFAKQELEITNSICGMRQKSLFHILNSLGHKHIPRFESLTKFSNLISCVIVRKWY